MALFSVELVAVAWLVWRNRLHLAVRCCSHAGKSTIYLYIAWLNGACGIFIQVYSHHVLDFRWHIPVCAVPFVLREHFGCWNTRTVFVDVAANRTQPNKRGNENESPNLVQMYVLVSFFWNHICWECSLFGNWTMEMLKGWLTSVGRRASSKGLCVCMRSGNIFHKDNAGGEWTEHCWANIRHQYRCGMRYYSTLFWGRHERIVYFIYARYVRFRRKER